MTETTTETPTRKRNVSSGRATQILRQYREEYRRIYQEAADRARTHEWVLETRKKRIFDHPDFRRLPRWAAERISEFGEVLYSDWSYDHFWTHVHEGQRIHAGCPGIEFDYGKISQMDHTNGVDRSCHCQGYVVDGRVVLVPNAEDDLQNELNVGRLPFDDLQEIRHSRPHPCPKIRIRSNRVLVETEYVIDYRFKARLSQVMEG